MKGEWCYFNQYLNKSTCERIIRELKPLCKEEGKIGSEKESLNSILDLEVRKAKTCFIYATDTRYEYIFDLFWKTAIRANDDFFQFHISKLSYIQFSEYDSLVKGHYKAHRDVFWINGDPVYHRKLSGMIQLSDPSTYEGGNFDIVDRDISSRPTLLNEVRNQGTILYIPSFVEHQVTPVTKGVRYSLVAWFEGKKWT
jgi:PKHD-type hydroxylase